MKRFFDIIVSIVGLSVLLILFLLIAILIKLDSRGPVLFRQDRVGRHQKLFTLYKFRSMRVMRDNQNLLTVGSKDARITSLGYWLRKLKLDELPQLYNVLIGDMSIVGPRPEVPKYVKHYTQEQKRVFEVRPGITDEASIEYSNESELLGGSTDPEKLYLTEILPEKLKMGVAYVDHHTIFGDIRIIFKTIKAILS